MRRLLHASLAVSALAGCSLASPPQSEAEVAAELAKIEPPKAGRWSSHFDLTAFEANGAPAQVADRLQRELAARGRLGQVTCVTPGMIRDMFKGRMTTYDGASCRVVAFRMQEASYSATLQCNYHNELSGTIELEGQSGSDASRESAKVELTLISNPEKRVNYALESRSELLGPCGGK